MDSPDQTLGEAVRCRKGGGAGTGEKTTSRTVFNMNLKPVM
jgi:hypothetical protein